MKVLVVAALEEELKPFLDLYDNWVRRTSPRGDIYFNCLVELGGVRSEIYAAVSPKYSKVACASHVTRMAHLANPQVAIMVGICAGFTEKVKLGDLIISDKVYDYESGKLVKDILQLDIQSDELVPSLMGLVKSNRSEYEAELKKIDKFSGVGVHVGTFACGTAVVVNDEFFNNIRKTHDRNTVALDMESYAFFEAIKGYSHSCYAVVAKGGCDYATIEKGDSYHDRAAEISATWASYFLNKDVHSLPQIEFRNHLQDVFYPISLPRPALNLEDRELWRKVVGWGEEHEDFFKSKLMEDDSGLTFYNIGDGKYILEVSLGFYAYQAGYLYVFLDESKEKPYFKILEFREFYFEDLVEPYAEGLSSTLTGLANIDVPQRAISVYHKFCGLGDGFSASYIVSDYGDTKLVKMTRLVLNEDASGEEDSLTAFDVNVDKEYPSYGK